MEQQQIEELDALGAAFARVLPRGVDAETALELFLLLGDLYEQQQAAVARAIEETRAECLAWWPVTMH